MDSRKGDEQSTIKVASSASSKKDGGSRTGTIKLKKPPPKIIKPGNWKDGSIIDHEQKKSTNNSPSLPSSPGPVVSLLDEIARETFATGRPLEDSPDLLQCKHCKKSVLKTAAKTHIAQCLKVKREKAQRKKEAREARERAKEMQREEEARKQEEENGDAKDEESDDEEERKVATTTAAAAATAPTTTTTTAAAAPTTAPTTTSTSTTTAAAATAAATATAPTKKVAGKKPGDEKVGGKKRKADVDAEKGPKAKKKKDESKAKIPKPKGPVDVERQCGVILPNGQPCARSLTCKSHSMGAKRAVVGRSLPYDMLLAAYQKKNQAKQQKAALDANAPLEDDDEINNGPVDSDEETAAVMNALAQWKPQPVVPNPTFVPIRRQYQNARLHEQLQMATNGGRINIFAVTGYGAQRFPEGHPGHPGHSSHTAQVDMEDAPGEPEPAGHAGPSRSASFGMPAPPPRSISVSSRA